MAATAATVVVAAIVIESTVVLSAAFAAIATVVVAAAAVLSILVRWPSSSSSSRSTCPSFQMVDARESRLLLSLPPAERAPAAEGSTGRVQPPPHAACRTDALAARRRGEGIDSVDAVTLADRDEHLQRMANAGPLDAGVLGQIRSLGLGRQTGWHDQKRASQRRHAITQQQSAHAVLLGRTSACTQTGSGSTARRCPRWR